MSSDVIVEIGHSLGNIFCAGHVNHNAVGDFKILVLADILHAVNYFACNTFALQFIGYSDIESHSHLVVAGNKPTGDIFGDDVDVGHLNYGFIAVDIECKRAGLLEFDYIFLAHGSHSCSHLFHELSKLRTKFLEVGFHSLHQNSFVVRDELDVLDVHLVENKSAHSLDISFLLIVDSRNHD